MCLLGTHVYRLECIPEWVLLVAGMLVDMLVEVVVMCMSFVVLFVGGVSAITAELASLCYLTTTITTEWHF